MNQNLPEVWSFLLERTAQVMKQHTQRKLTAGNFGVTIHQFALLKKLQEEGAMSQTELAAGTFKDAPTITRIVDLLAKVEAQGVDFINHPFVTHGQLKWKLLHDFGQFQHWFGQQSFFLQSYDAPKLVWPVSCFRNRQRHQ